MLAAAVAFRRAAATRASDQPDPANRAFRRADNRVSYADSSMLQMLHV